jgi:hypothetical protein
MSMPKKATFPEASGEASAGLADDFQVPAVPAATGETPCIQSVVCMRPDFHVVDTNIDETDPMFDATPRIMEQTGEVPGASSNREDVMPTQQDVQLSQGHTQGHTQGPGSGTHPAESGRIQEDEDRLRWERTNQTMRVSAAHFISILFMIFEGLVPCVHACECVVGRSCVMFAHAATTFGS